MLSFLRSRDINLSKFKFIQCLRSQYSHFQYFGLREFPDVNTGSKLTSSKIGEKPTVCDPLLLA